MTYESLNCEKKEPIVRLTLNRLGAGNLIDLQLANELKDACREVNEDDDIRVVVLTGAGNVFCSGADLGGILSSTLGDIHRTNPASIASRAVASITCPVIAAINGDAMGAGLELALACDIRVASGNARLGFPETSYGLIPGGGGTQRLPRLVGRGKATEMILLAEPVNAAEAYQAGLVNRVVLPQKLVEEVDAVAEILASRAPIAVRYAKEAVNKGTDMTLEQGLRLEADLSFLLQSTADRDEGIRAFLEKRKGQFKGE